MIIDRCRDEERRHSRVIFLAGLFIMACLTAFAMSDWVVVPGR